MAWVIEGGPRQITTARDAEGHREYKVSLLARAASSSDTPAGVYFATGLPRPGDDYAYGHDIDAWAFCLPVLTATPHEVKDGESPKYMVVEVTYSTKPPEGSKSRCNDNPVEDPLLEPAKVSGGASKYTEEAAEDRFGFPLLTSSHEQIRGPQVEFDANRPTTVIEQNVATFEAVAAAYRMLDCVNAFPIWGFGYRQVKLSDVTWERKYYGRCYVYYTRRLSFDFNVKTFDRTVLDEGTKVLHGRWGSTGSWVLIDIDGQSPDPDNPQHFDRFQDRNGNVCRVILNGRGLPAGVQIGTGSNVIVGSIAGPIFMSLTTVHEASDLEDADKWVRLTGVPDPAHIYEYEPDVGDYPRGSLVYFAATGTSYQTWVQVNEDGSDQVPGAGSDWVVVVPNYRGQYSATTATGTPGYAVGDYVSLGPAPGRFGSNVSGIGSVFIQKYEEDDFLSLGVPLEL
jgi:hypothetical protein